MNHLYTVRYREVRGIEATNELREFLENWQNQQDGNYSLTYEEALRELEDMSEEDITHEISDFVAFLCALNDENHSTYDFAIF